MTQVLPQWAAERTVTPERAAALIRTVAPSLAGRPVVPLADGWDNSVLVVDAVWAFRFARRSVALPGIAREIAVLPAIAPLLPLPVPVPELVGDDAHPVEPWPFTGARLLPGVELAESVLGEVERVDLAASVGRFLAVLHGADAAAAARSACPDLPVDPLDRGWPRRRMTHTRRTLDALVTDRVWSVDPAVMQVLDRATALGTPSGSVVLVHGDLHVRHVLVDPAGAATGVIDWGDVCLADPSVDLALAYAAFDGDAREALLAAYGPVDETSELRARALAIRLSALLASYAAADSRPALLREALDGLHRSAR